MISSLVYLDSKRVAIIFSLAFSFNRLNFPMIPPRFESRDSPLARAISSR